ncbi:MULTISPECIES: hypothetical protein [unclassified Marinobacter]|uniref:hypothetical protein n=1 Tax=unclassified Marinobacter TaxID=83889 RepID=UPI000BF83028|nr:MULTISPECIES: hypothetical protein [unclassified Marinobacter]PFG09752.1 hypothetical protein ATI45_2144 [Marinobacter sp. LV10MA510-1]PFG51682.1 hypothetical protein ATG98_0639 [Marinobacter sp. LV10R520-4]
MRYVIALVVGLFLAGTAQASQCPTLVHKIDSELESRQLPAEAVSEIQALRDQGEKLHQQGKHSESLTVLERAMERLDEASQ